MIRHAFGTIVALALVATSAAAREPARPADQAPGKAPEAALAATPAPPAATPAPPAATPPAAPAAPAGERTELVLDRVVVAIGDDAITLHEVEKRAAAARNPVAEAVAGTAPEKGGLEAALDDLVAERLLLEQARGLDISVPEAEVDKHVQGIMDQNGWSADEFATAIRMLGFQDVVSYREHARRELTKSQVLRLKVGAKVRVTEREIDEEFNRQFDGGKTEEEVHLWHIVFQVPEHVTLPQIRELIEKAQKVRDEAASGPRPFEDVAREFGQDGSAERGGDVGWFGRGRLQPSLEEAAFALPDGEVSPVVQSSAGFHVLRVTERRRVALKDPEEARARVRFELSEAAFKKLYLEYVQELRAGVRVQTVGGLERL
ncbi:MAG: peptidylprolyl isomerase [Deltaproteobacteria bacterium]|nr:peptidylprolyl isomerase [Deltaproteobacteria bacterium]